MTEKTDIKAFLEEKGIDEADAINALKAGLSEGKGEPEKKEKKQPDTGTDADTSTDEQPRDKQGKFKGKGKGKGKDKEKGAEGADIDDVDELIDQLVAKRIREKLKVERGAPPENKTVGKGDDDYAVHMGKHGIAPGMREKQQTS